MIFKDLFNKGALERKDESRTPYLVLLLMTAAGTALNTFEQVTIFTDRLVGESKYLIGGIFILLFLIVAVNVIWRKDPATNDGIVYYHYPQSRRIVAKIAAALLVLIAGLMVVSAVQDRRSFPLVLEGNLLCPDGTPASDYQVAVVDKADRVLNKNGSFATDGRGYFVILTPQPAGDGDYLRFTHSSGETTHRSLRQYILHDDTGLQHEISSFTLDFCP